MSGFDAKQVVDALDFDFTTLTRPDGTSYEGKGTIPEPSHDAVNALFNTLRQTALDAGVPPEALGSDKDVMTALGGQPKEVLEAISDKTTDALMNLCAGTPSREEFEALPFRQRQAFQAWLLGELTNPTKPDTRR